jgi:hypothetical protein
VGTAYENAQTSWDAGAGVAAPPVPPDAPLPASGQQAVAGGEGGDEWDVVRLTAGRALETVEVERDITNVFNTRNTLSQRLADAAKRKDERMAAKAAQDWIKSEVQLNRLFARYQRHINERNALVEHLENASPTVAV